MSHLKSGDIVDESVVAKPYISTEPVFHTAEGSYMPDLAGPSESERARIMGRPPDPIVSLVMKEVPLRSGFLSSELWLLVATIAANFAGEIKDTQTGVVAVLAAAIYAVARTYLKSKHSVIAVPDERQQTDVMLDPEEAYWGKPMSGSSKEEPH